METPTFSAPPVVELVLGVQFSRLEKLSSAHFGRFWSALGESWDNPSDCTPLEDQFEVFDQPRWKSSGKPSIRFSAVPFPGRFMIEHVAHGMADRMIQVQPTRFHYNWRKRDNVYPSYKSLISEFEAKYELFSKFVQDEQLGELSPNQWELTYVDAFGVDDYWSSPTDWSRFLPGLFSDLFSTDSLNIQLENRAAEWVYEIKPKIGRLHISAQTGRWGGGEKPVLLLQMTARGPLGKGGVESLREGLDIGHSAAVGSFLAITDKSCQARWGFQR